MRRMIRSATAGLLVMASLTLTPFSQPETALAADASVSTCDFATFQTTLAAVQVDGGGVITFGCAGTIVFENPQTLTADVTLIGNGQVVLDGNESVQLFEVSASARLALSDLTLQNGSADLGGAIRNDGTLEIAASTFSVNSAGAGGAIDNRGTLEITASSFSGNHAGLDGGAIYNAGTLEITGSTFSGNSSGDRGGAIHNDGTLTVTVSTFSANSAGRGGAIFNFNGTLSVNTNES